MTASDCFFRKGSDWGHQKGLHRAGTIWFGLWSIGRIQKSSQVSPGKRGHRGRTVLVCRRHGCKSIWEERRNHVGGGWKDVLEPNYERPDWPRFSLWPSVFWAGEEKQPQCWQGRASQSWLGYDTEKWSWSWWGCWWGRRIPGRNWWLTEEKTEVFVFWLSCVYKARNIKLGS